MNEIRLKWEPENLTPLTRIEERLAVYTKGQGGVTILRNGTLLFLTKGDDDVADAKQALNEARFITDFRVIPMKEGDYMVRFHPAVAVYVSQDEIDHLMSEIVARQEELKFPSEVMFVPPNDPPHHVYIGLYARGKLQRDAYHFDFYRRL